jgi:predicted acyl esterase
MSGSSAGATTTFAAAPTRHPSLRAFFAQAGCSSIYDDVVCERQSIEMERLWLWVAKNIPGLSASHRQAVMQRFDIGATELDAAAERAPPTAHGVGWPPDPVQHRIHHTPAPIPRYKGLPRSQAVATRKFNFGPGSQGREVGWGRKESGSIP